MRKGQNDEKKKGSDLDKHIHGGENYVNKKNEEKIIPFILYFTHRPIVRHRQSET